MWAPRAVGVGVRLGRGGSPLHLPEGARGCLGAWDFGFCSSLSGICSLLSKLRRCLPRWSGRPRRPSLLSPSLSSPHFSAHPAFRFMLLALAVMITEISLFVRVAKAVRFSISILYGLQQRSGEFKHLTVRIFFQNPITNHMQSRNFLLLRKRSSHLEFGVESHFARPCRSGVRSVAGALRTGHRLGHTA